MQAWLIDYNYAQLSSTAISATSSDAAFPVSNVKNPIRSRVHRSSGYFVITAANQKINFKESGGGLQLTATIPAGTYASPALLAAAVSAAMGAAGDATYTASYSSLTGLWTIASDGAFLSILWLTGTDTASSIGVTLGYDVTADDTGALTYTGTLIAIHSHERIVFDLNTTEEIDTIALLFDLVNGKKLTDDAEILIEANPTDTWDSPAYSQALTVNDLYGMAALFLEAPESYRFWSLKITDTANPYLYVETSKVIIGKSVQLAVSPGRGFSEVTRDTSQVQETDYGHRYADAYPLRRELEFAYPGISKDDTAKLQLAYRRNGQVRPVVFALDPLAAAYDKERFFIYGYFDDRMGITHVSGTAFAVPLKITEAV